MVAQEQVRELRRMSRRRWDSRRGSDSRIRSSSRRGSETSMQFLLLRSNMTRSSLESFFGTPKKSPVARTPPSAVPEADVKPQLPVNEMVQRATLALEQVAGRPSGLFNVEKVDPKFKLLGAQGRV